MHYIIVEPIEGYTSQERAEAISQELFNVGRPPGVRHPDDVSTSVFGTIQHPDTGAHALSVDLAYEIYVHPENDLTQLLLLFPEVTEEEKVVEEKRQIEIPIVPLKDESFALAFSPGFTEWRETERNWSAVIRPGVTSSLEGSERK